MPEGKLAGGKPDSQVCGFDTFVSPLKEILEKFGKPNASDRDSDNGKGVAYRWEKGPLRILAKTYEVDDYLERPPVWIEVSGTDPERLCPTGRGIALGDGLTAVRKAYGGRYGVTRLEEGGRMITVGWKTLQTLDIDIGKDNRVSRINVAGDIE